MRNWQKFVVPALAVASLCLIYLFFIWYQRQDTSAPKAAQVVNRDDVAVVRLMFPAHFDDVAAMAGTTVWMKDGYAIPYYSYDGDKVQFADKEGLIPAAMQLRIKKVIKSDVPADEDDGMEHGAQQVFVIFSVPGSEKEQLFAVPIGYVNVEDTQEAYYCDQLFFYDDPHTIYNNWPDDIWSAIDIHHVLPGMNELQTKMAIGQKSHSDSTTVGNRTVNYDQAGKRWTITFVKNHATAISSN